MKKLMLKDKYLGLLVYSDGYRGHQSVVLLESKDEIEIMKRFSSKFESKDCDFIIIDQTVDMCSDWFGLDVEDLIKENYLSEGWINKYFEVKT